MFRAGELQGVWVPDADHEAMREPVRARQTAIQEVRRSRQLLLSFLLRHDRSVPTRQHWTRTHRSRLARQSFAHPAEQIVFEALTQRIEVASARQERIEDAIRTLLPAWSLATVVAAIQALRGIAMLAAVTLVAEIGDFGRFSSPRQLMAWLWLVPKEHSSGRKVARGNITEAGNARARRLLVEGAWTYRMPGRMGEDIFRPARYEADLAERRYESVDPANRLIAATLEQRCNDAIQRLHDLEAELAAFERQTMRAVTAEQKRQIIQLAEDFPRLWAASTIAPRDRKRILRLLVRDITVSKGPEAKTVRLHVRWQGGATETLELQLPPNRAEAVRYPEAFVARIRELAANHHDDEIVQRLRPEGYQSSTCKPLTESMIKWLRCKHRIPTPQPPEDTFSLRQLGERYGVSHWVVHYWTDRGLVAARQRRPNAPYAIAIDNQSDQFLQEWVTRSAHLRTSSLPQTA